MGHVISVRLSLCVCPSVRPYVRFFFNVQIEMGFLLLQMAINVIVQFDIMSGMCHSGNNNLEMII